MAYNQCTKVSDNFITEDENVFHIKKNVELFSKQNRTLHMLLIHSTKKWLLTANLLSYCSLIFTCTFNHYYLVYKTFTLPALQANVTFFFNSKFHKLVYMYMLNLVHKNEKRFIKKFSNTDKGIRVKLCKF